jgi:hypothetical protein
VDSISDMATEPSDRPISTRPSQEPAQKNDLSENCAEVRPPINENGAWFVGARGGRVGIGVKSGHRAFSNGSGCGSRDFGNSVMSRAKRPKRQARISLRRLRNLDDLFRHARPHLFRTRERAFLQSRPQSQILGPRPAHGDRRRQILTEARPWREPNARAEPKSFRNGRAGAFAKHFRMAPLRLSAICEVEFYLGELERDLDR